MTKKVLTKSIALIFTMLTKTRLQMENEWSCKFKRRLVIAVRHCELMPDQKVTAAIRPHLWRTPLNSCLVSRSKIKMCMVLCRLHQRD